MRIGQGYDAHAFVKGRKLIVGGVDIPCEKGLAGHSDADVLLHAVCDALLGAAALGDIGLQFPDSDARYEGVSSLKLLQSVCALLRERGWRVGNVDCTVVAQCPRFSPYTDAMRANIAGALGVEKGAVSVKSTTEDGLGFTGAEKGIAAHAFCLIEEG